MKWNLGDKITSIAIEEHGAVGTIIDIDFDRVRINWDTGGQSYENNEV